MANDLVTRMLLDKKQWDSGLTDATRQMGQFRASVSGGQATLANFTKGMGLSITKFAGWAAAGTLAKEGLEKFMRAGQETSDWIDNNVNAWKATFDSFFEALNHGDVSGFLSNMDAIRSAAYETSAAIDNLRDAVATMGVLSTKYKTQQAQIRNAYMRTNDPKEKAALRQQAEQLGREFNALAVGVVNANVAVIESVINERYQAGLSRRGVREAWTTYNGNTRRQSVTGGKILPEEYMDMVARWDVLGGASSQMAKDAKKFGQLVDEYEKSGGKMHGAALEPTERAFVNKYGISPFYVNDWDQLNETGRQKIRDAMQGYYQAGYEKAAFDAGSNRMFRESGGARGGRVGRRGGGVSVPKEQTPEGTLKWFDQQISALNQQLKVTADPAKYAQLTASLKALEKGLENLNKALNEAVLNSSNWDFRNLSDQDTIMERMRMADITAPTGMASILPKLDKSRLGVSMAGMTDPFKDWLVSFRAKEFEELNTKLTATASLMRSLGGILGEGAGGWLNYAASVASAVSGAIASIRSLIPATEALTMANALKGASQMGPLGWLQFGAAIASVIAAFAQLPKFATGGVVGGSSYSGDRVPALLNSGEMVLNRAQQSNLWRMVNSQAVSGRHGQVEFRIDGSTLVGVLDNQGRKSRLTR